MNQYGKAHTLSKSKRNCQIENVSKNSLFEFDVNVVVGEDEEVARQQVDLSLGCVDDLELGQKFCDSDFDLRHREPHPDALTLAAAERKVGELRRKVVFRFGFRFQKSFRLEFFRFREVFRIVVHRVDRENDDRSFLDCVRTDFAILDAFAIQSKIKI